MKSSAFSIIVATLLLQILPFVDGAQGGCDSGCDFYSSCPGSTFLFNKKGVCNRRYETVQGTCCCDCRVGQGKNEHCTIRFLHPLSGFVGICKPPLLRRSTGSNYVPTMTKEECNEIARQIITKNQPLYPKFDKERDSVHPVGQRGIFAKPDATPTVYKDKRLGFTSTILLLPIPEDVEAKSKFSNKAAYESCLEKFPSYRKSGKEAVKFEQCLFAKNDPCASVYSRFQTYD